MPIHSFARLRGTLTRIEIDSQALKENRLHDPHVRSVEIYLPPDYHSTSHRYPLLVYLAAFGGSGLKQSNWSQFGENLPQRIERLMTEGRMGPVVLALPDCFTSLGGNQYVNSPVMGNWEDFLLGEMLPALERNFRILPGPGKHAVLGYSSGGYGCLVQGLRHGESWGAIACHSADIGFENMFLGEFPRLMTRLAAFDHKIEFFLQRFGESHRIHNADFETLMMIAMAASYDPAPDETLGIRFPVDPYTARLIPERWQQWLRNDPLVLILDPACQRRLRMPHALFLDCGSKDQFHLQYGARRFSQALTELGIPHTYEEHEGDHLGLNHRMDRSLPVLYKALDS